MAAKPITESVIEKTRPTFWGRVSIGRPDECWEWQGKLDTHGYGQVKVFGSWWRATRIALALAGRLPPPNLFACHHCDNPPCCNPHHLFLGTPQDNTDDRVSKGRTLERRGSKNPRAVLSADQVREIKASDLGYRTIAKRFGVGARTIRDIRSGRNWSHIR